jgi:S-adenosylmethionine:tRNA ribosyltransferase-isomerase
MTDIVSNSTGLSLSDYDYDLPPELIAQTPIEPRDHSRLMVVHRADRRIEHRRFSDLPEYLRPGDVMVFNDSRVFPARTYGKRKGTGKKIELLLLARQSPCVWQALVKPGKYMRVGAEFKLSGGGHAIEGEVIEVHDDGSRTVRLSSEEHLDDIGVVPLPPYISEPLTDSERYQTVYSREKGSVAAPTAGLHFTPELLQKIRSIGVETAFVTLHVGWGTFRPVESDDVSEHDMHSEFFVIGEQAADTINHAKHEGRRIITIGTTAARLLEHAANLVVDEKTVKCPVRPELVEGQSKQDKVLEPTSGWADIFIYPGYEFRVVDTLVTNFHLPKSTLLMLVSALADRDLVFQAYKEAIDHRYRFYSFGDAMLIL